MLLAAVVAVGLVACTPDDDPSDPDTPTGSTSTSTSTEEPTTDAGPSPTDDVPTPPDLDQPTPPEEMGVDDRAGAAAAIEHFFALVDYADASGDTRALQSLSGSECESCTATIAAIEEVHENGGWTDAEPSVLSDVVVAFPETNEVDYFVGFTLTSNGATRHNGDGSRTDLSAFESSTASALVRWSGGSFVVTSLNALPDA